MKVCEQKFPIIQYLDLSSPSIMRWNISGAVSEFDCIRVSVYR